MAIITRLRVFGKQFVERRLYAGGFPPPQRSPDGGADCVRRSSPTFAEKVAETGA
jgi:hypothetical protein